MPKRCSLLEGEPLIPIFDEVMAILILAIVAGGGGLAPLELSHLCRRFGRCDGCSAATDATKRST